jgi:hypothetical protein
MFWNNAQEHMLSYSFKQLHCWSNIRMVDHNHEKEGKPVSYMAPKEGALT